jgi:quercetin dioxygenase-like cupin family protein
MLCRVFYAAAILCLAASVATAQDPTKVEPKHYRLQFENEHVQVVSVHYGPHEKSEMHDHPGGVVVVITGGHLRFTDQNGKVTEVYSKAGEARWFPPFKHKVENVGDEPYNAVYVGLKSRMNAGAARLKPDSAALPPEIAQLLLEYAKP